MSHPLYTGDDDSLLLSVLTLDEDGAAKFHHDKGRDCARTEEVLDNYRHRALVAEAECLRLRKLLDN